MNTSNIWNAQWTHEMHDAMMHRWITMHKDLPGPHGWWPSCDLWLPLNFIACTSTFKVCCLSFNNKLPNGVESQLVMTS